MTQDPIKLAQSVLDGDKTLTPTQRGTLLRQLAKVAGKPADIDSRICFGIEFFDSEDKAHAAHLVSRLQGNTYNGGWFHGMACGRDSSFDYVVKPEHLANARPSDSLITQKVKVGTKLFAVTC